MICVIATFQLKQENLDKAVKMATELVQETRKETGCARYDLVQSVDDGNQIVILEAWESQKDLDVHSASEHFQRLVPAIADLCVQPPSVKSFTQLV